MQQLLAAVFDAVQTGLIEPLLAGLGTPEPVRGFLVDGVWLGITTVLSFTPIIFVFYLLMAVVEDSGYLPRAAFLMDGFMHWLGLDGRAFVLQVMGFGCNVPSILGTRVIRDRGMRLLAMLVIPFALCQARLTVFIFLAAIFFPRSLVGSGTGGLRLLPAEFRGGDPHRPAVQAGVPRRRDLRAGAAALPQPQPAARSCGAPGCRWATSSSPPGPSSWWEPPPSGCSRTCRPDRPAQAAAWPIGIGHLFAPVFAPIGLDPSLTVALFFGFIAKEILLGAMAVIYRTSEAGLGTAIQNAITPLQALSFMTFTLLYTPCLSTVVAQLKESRSRSFALRRWYGP